MNQLLACLPYGFLLAGICTVAYGFIVTKDRMESWWHGISSMCFLLVCLVGEPALYERLFACMVDLLWGMLHPFTSYLAARPTGGSVMSMLEITGIATFAKSVPPVIACVITCLGLIAVCVAPAFGATAAALSWRKIPDEA